MSQNNQQKNTLGSDNATIVRVMLIPVDTVYTSLKIAKDIPNATENSSKRPRRIPITAITDGFDPLLGAYGSVIWRRILKVTSELSC